MASKFLTPAATQTVNDAITSPENMKTVFTTHANRNVHISPYSYSETERQDAKSMHCGAS